MHHHFSVLLPVGVLLLPLASTTPISTLEPASYGHWDLTYTFGNPASGYRWENVNANYSSSPESSAVDVAVQCKQLYDPTVQTTTRSCDDVSFGYEVTEDGGQRWISVRQTVQLGGASGVSTAPVTITGKSAIVVACGKGASGRMCEGAARVEAGLVERRSDAVEQA